MSDADVNYEHLKKTTTIPPNYRVVEPTETDVDVSTLLFLNAERAWVDYTSNYHQDRFQDLWAAGATLVICPARLAAPATPVFTPPAFAPQAPASAAPIITAPAPAPVPAPEPVAAPAPANELAPVAPPSVPLGLVLPKIVLPKPNGEPALVAPQVEVPTMFQAVPSEAPAAPVALPVAPPAPAPGMLPPPLPVPVQGMLPSFAPSAAGTLPTQASAPDEAPEGDMREADDFDSSATYDLWELANERIKAMQALADDLHKKLVRGFFENGIVPEGTNNVKLKDGRTLQFVGKVNRPIDDAALNTIIPTLRANGVAVEEVFPTTYDLALSKYRKLPDHIKLICASAITEKPGKAQLKIKEAK